MDLLGQSAQGEVPSRRKIEFRDKLRRIVCLKLAEPAYLTGS